MLGGSCYTTPTREGRGWGFWYICSPWGLDTRHGYKWGCGATWGALLDMRHFNGRQMVLVMHSSATKIKSKQRASLTMNFVSPAFGSLQRLERSTVLHEVCLRPLLSSYLFFYFFKCNRTIGSRSMFGPCH